MTLLDDLDRRRERADRDNQNGARLAQAFATFETTGIGSLQHHKRIPFGTTFIEQPFVAYGTFIDVDRLADAEEVEDTDDAVLPLCTGYVVEWDQDDRDFYTGCWVAVRVYFPPGPDPLDLTAPTELPEVTHHFTFSAIAMKDIPTDATDQVD